MYVRVPNNINFVSFMLDSSGQLSAFYLRDVCPLALTDMQNCPKDDSKEQKI